METVRDVGQGVEGERQRRGQARHKHVVVRQDMTTFHKGLMPGYVCFLTINLEFNEDAERRVAAKHALERKT